MESIKELKQICGKPARSIRAKFYRNASYYFTWILLKLRFTANQVSALGMTLGIFSAVLFAFGQYIVASILFFFSALSDYSDGEVARYRKYKGMKDEPLRDLGNFFDTLNHIPRPMIFLCLSINFLNIYPSIVIVAIGFLSAIFCYLDSGFFGVVDNISKFICLKNYRKSSYKSKIAIFVRNHFYSLLLTPIFLLISSTIDFIFHTSTIFYLWILFALCGAFLFMSKVVNKFGCITNIGAGNSTISRSVHSTSFWRRWWNTLVFGADYKGRKYTLLVLLFFGLCGSVFIDFDHFFIQQFQMVRPFHLPIWIISGIFCFSYYSYLYRRVYKSGIDDNYEK